MVAPWRQKALVAGLGSIAAVVSILIGTPAQAVSGGTAQSGPGYVAKLRNSAGSCSGVLIDPSWVLTAGGCFGTAKLASNGTPPLATTVVVGRSQLSTTTGHQVNASRVIPHPDRNLVLVGLSEPVTDVTPARLATTAASAGDTLTVSSFGRTADQWIPDRLQSAPFVVTDTSSNAVSVEGGGATTALCRGDAGAPAVRTTGAVAEVVGLASTSEQAGCYNEPVTSTGGVLSRTDGLEDWIASRAKTSDYVPLTSMTRVFDSRKAVGISTDTPLAGDAEYSVPILGVGDIPTSNVAAVVLDLSVHEATTYTQVKLWADGTTRPALQGLVHNKDGVEPLGNAAVIPVGANGKIRLWHAAGAAHVVVDVHGYLTKNSNVPTAGGFIPVTQARIVDTRNDIGTTAGAIPAGDNRTFTLTGSGVPSGTETIFANVVLFSPTTDGFLRMLPGSGVTTGTGGPDVSFPTRTYSAGTTIKLSGNKVTIINYSDSAVQMAIDVQGYFSRDASTGGGYHYADARVLDTRSMTTRLAGGATLNFQVTGVGGLPKTGVTAAAMNIHTYKAGQDSNILSVWPTGTTRPGGYAHYQPGNNVATGTINRTSLAIIPTGTDGKISVRNNSETETDVYIELEGWFQDQAPADTPATPPTEGALIEDLSYPGFAEIERTQNVHLISGDGNLVMVACSTPSEGDIGVIRVRTTETIGASANGLLCFKVLATPARLKLEVPAVYEIRGDGLKSGVGHKGTANITTDDGDRTTVAINPSSSLQLGIGVDPDNEPTTLLQLDITG